MISTKNIRLIICTAMALVGIWATPPAGAQSLPFWLDGDIGGVSIAGSATYSSGVYTVKGSGDDVWNQADAFHYVHYPLNGDGEMVLHVLSQGGTDPWAKVGPMIRETLDPGSKHAFMAVTPGNGTSFQRRLKTASDSTHTTPGDGITVPYYLKLTREGSTFTGYKSVNGIDWVLVGSDVITMQSSVHVGFAVTSHNNSLLCATTLEIPQTAPAISQNPQSQSVNDGAASAFDVKATGAMPLFYQWRRNGANLASATNGSLILDPTTAAMAGNYSVLVTNAAGTAISSDAVLTVSVDSAPPVISAVTNPRATNVLITFSEAVQASSGTNTANYSLNNGAAILAAGFGVNSQTIVLQTTVLTVGATYTLTVNNVRDRSSAGNLIAANSQKTFVVADTMLFGLWRDVYLNAADGSLSSLTNNPVFPDSPSTSELWTNSFETPANSGIDNYGQRLRGYIIPPVSGNYVFWISGDDNSTLFVSSDETPANKQVVAWVGSWTGSREWTKEANQQSLPITLEAGKVYYTEALMAQGGGGDNLAVRWQLPDTTIEEPIPASRLIPWGTVFGPPVIRTHPANTNAVEGGAAVFSIALSSVGPVSYQWQRDGANILGANQISLTNDPVLLSDSGARFRCVVSNTKGTTNSLEATLTVSADTTRPTLVSAYSQGDRGVLVTFSERVDFTSASQANNYTLNNGIAVTQAAPDASGRGVLLTTGPMTYGTGYVLTVNGVKDQAGTPNTITSGSQIAFTALELTPQNIGNPAQSFQIAVVAGGIDVTGGGADIGGASDQFNFNYQLKSGDFDLKARIGSLGLSDSWAKAGLMARETLDGQSRFAAALATPSISGCFFEQRQNAGGAGESSGSFPANYPNTWLRLQRIGNQFSGYASYDGQMWTLLNSVTLAMPVQVYVGLALSSHDPVAATTVQFRDYGSAAGGVTGRSLSPFEPLGPSSRKTGLVISEIMYKPAPRADGKVLEYLELFNSNPYPEDISGYRISGSVDFEFPSNTTLPGGGFLVIAGSPVDFQSVYGLSNVMGPYKNTLKNSGTIRLRNNRDAIFLEVNYAAKPPWPVAADGTGHSLVLGRPSYGEDDPKAWDISDVVGGSPGSVKAYRPSPQRSVMINEILVRAVFPAEAFVELYNHSNQAVDLSGCVLTDDPVTNKHILPPGTSIPARGFLSFTAAQLGFAFNPEGGTLFFKNTRMDRVLDALRYEAKGLGAAFGRYPNGASEWYPLVTATPGATNSAIRIHDIVIDEILFNPISGDDDDQYVELYNQGALSVDLSGWKLTAGINFTFPTNFMIGAKSYVVVGRNSSNLVSKYPNLNAGNCVGNFSGSLSHGGERLVLTMPDTIVSTNALFVVKTNAVDIAVDEVTYGSGGRWGNWAGGGGSSMELRDPRSNHRLAQNWADSDETAKSTWSTVEFTGVLDNGYGAADNLQITLLGEGECLVDNVEVLNQGNAANLVVNPTFESGLANWTMQGDHVRSSLENSGYAGSHSLHIRASARGDTGANRIRADLTGPLLEGQNVTLRAHVRWLKGWPEIILRLHGNYLEAYGKLNVPMNLGTPGAANSRSVANAGPAIYEVAHSPTVPAAGEAVVVTARAQDPDGFSAIRLDYRMDPNASYTTVSMVDDGTGGDSVAGDGVYSATIPGQAANQMVAFYVEATDKAAASSRFPADAPARECLVMFGDPVPTTSFGTYRYWITQANVTTWSARENLSNEPIDSTFVYGNFRAVYNVGGRYSGSPYHQGFNSPVGGACHYSFDLPPDDQALGTTSFNKIHAPGNGPFDDLTLQREQTAYRMARQLDLPWNYKRYVVCYVNGNRRGTLMEDTQVPNGDIVDEYFPNDPRGQLYKLQPWFEFGNETSGAMNFANVSWCTLNNYTTTGGAKKLARYRYNYLTRAAGHTANNYTNVFNLVDAANVPAGPGFITSMETQADMGLWMRTFAINHAVGNWDSFGFQNAQNMYAYKPENGRWSLMIWDFNIVLGNSGSYGPTGDNLFAYNGADGPMGVIYSTPKFRRLYWQALEDIARRPMDVALMSPMMDSIYTAFTDNGISVASPAAIKSWMASRQNYLRQQLATVASDFAIASNNGLNFSTNKSLLALSGRAPVSVRVIKVNGVEYAVTWNTVTGWTMNLPLNAGVNALLVQGFDAQGVLVTNAAQSISVTYTGAGESPVGHVVINEIMYHPQVTDAEFIELFNTSTTSVFDLSRWRLEGAGFTFPDGTLIRPQGFVVVPKSQLAFVGAYGGAIPLTGQFGGNLKNGGETLKLVIPGATPDPDVIVDSVEYHDAAPWPNAADGEGSSLQLIDPNQDNQRVGNWTATPQWQQVQVTGAATSSLLYVYLTNAGDVYIDDLTLVAGGVAEAGTNLIGNGDFESALSGPWTVSSNLGSSGLTSASTHKGTNSLHLIASAAGSSKGDSLWQDTLPLINGNEYTLSFWYHAGTNTSGLVVRLSGSSSTSGLYAGVNAQPAGMAAYTPGAANNVKTTLPAFPSLYINEVQPENLAGPTDNNGEKDPWLELYNPGTNTISLNGYYLADNYTNLTQWPFPADAQIGPGQYLVVWLDGQPGQGTPAELHANFRIVPVGGPVVLSRMQSGHPVVFDYANYKNVVAGRSYGLYPNGIPDNHESFYYPTPGTANNFAYPPSTVVINEWMAGNTRTLLDAANGSWADWIELYNGGDAPVNLTGYGLTDILTDSAKFVIPFGYEIQPHSFLLVWADNNAGLNTNAGPDLHVNFKLGIHGESIGLFAPNHQLVDNVTFGEQTNDISQGRWPDGNASGMYFMASPTPGDANVIVNPPANAAPVLGVIADRSIDEKATLAFTATASDADLPSQTLTYSLDAGAPVGAVIGASSGVFTWTPTEAQGPSTNIITVRVTDNGYPVLSDAKTFTVTVNEVNSAPTLGNLGDLTVNEGQSVQFVITASDSDIPTQTLAFGLDAGAPGGASMNPATGEFTWTPSEAQGPGVYPITVRVTDNGAPVQSNSKLFTIYVNEVNQAPVLTGPSNVTANEGTPITFTAHAADGDLPTQTLTYTLDAGAPAGAGINASSGVFTWTPTEAQGPSTNIITVRVTDNGTPALNDAKAFTVIVNEVNQAPVLNTITNRTVSIGSIVSFRAEAHDNDSPLQTLTFSLGSGAPVGASIESSTGVFTWTPTAAGTNGIELRVTDNGSPQMSATQTFLIVVKGNARVPRITKITSTQTGLITVYWEAEPGVAYRLQYKLHANDAIWEDVGPSVTSTTTQATTTDTKLGGTQGYYRIVIIDQP